MKLGLKDKIDNLIKEYQAYGGEQADAIKKVLEPFKVPSYVNRFTQEGLEQTIKEGMDDILSNWKKYDKTLNDQVAAAVASAKKELMDALHMNQVNKSADYAIRIANAREFMKMELEDRFKDIMATNNEHKAIMELDDALFLILKDFVDDYDTMKLFAKMVEIKTHVPAANASGEPSLPKTFGRMMKVDSIMNAINEVEEAAAMLFIHARPYNNEVIRIHGAIYGVPADGYDEFSDEENILINATILDVLADKIDSEGQDFVSGEGQQIDVDEIRMRIQKEMNEGGDE